MNMIKWVVLGVIGMIVAFSLSLAYKLGAFKSVDVGVSDEPALMFLSKDHVGPYHKIVPIIQEVETWAKSKGLDCRRSFGEYLDNPQVVEEGRLRSRGGCVIEQKIEVPPDYVITEKPAQKYIKAVFTGSPSIGPFKVYGRVQQLAAENRLKLDSWNLEIYEIHSDTEMTTTYLFPLLD